MDHGLEIPADVMALQEMGADYWMRHYDWPVSEADYSGLVNGILADFDRLYEQQDPERRDLLLCDVAFVFFLIQFLHAGIAQTLCERKKSRIRVGSMASAYYHPSWDALSVKFRINAARQGSLQCHIKRIGKAVRFNEGQPFFARLLSPLRGHRVWSLGSFGRLKQEYLLSMNESCDHHYVQTILPQRSDLPKSPLPKEFESQLGAFLEVVRARIKDRYDVEFSLEEAARCWLKRLLDLEVLYRVVKGRRPVPEKLLVSEMGNPLIRVVTRALRARGTRVIGFHHGNDMTNAWELFSGYQEAACCDEFVCPTHAAQRFHSREYEMSGISRFHPVAFRSMESPLYLELSTRLRRNPPPKRVGKVMIVGHCMSPIRYLHSAGDFFLCQLDAELRVARLLRKAGMRVIYKRHPESPKAVAEIFKDHSDEVVSTPFERVHDRADAYFFGCITSTTFGFALCTNKPIFVLDIKGKNWNPEAYEKLRRRCAMIPARLDDRNRLEFDEKCVLEEVSREQKSPDFSYVEEFMFPRVHGNC